LIELLIALAIVSLITLMLFSGLRLGSRAWESVDAVTERVSEVRLARDFLVTTLSQARTTSLMVNAEQRTVFAGTRDAIEFVAPLSRQVGVPGLYVLRLNALPTGDHAALVLTRWLIHSEVLEGLDDAPAWEPMTEDTGFALDDLPLDLDAGDGAFGRTLILNRLAQFAFSYYGIQDAETEPDWHEDWLEQSTLPTLIQVRIATETQTWPDLMIAPPAPAF
jgi:general secretion pathway protein J